MHDLQAKSGVGVSAAGHAAGQAGHPPVSNGTFVLVWLALLVLTAVTVAASVWFPGRVGIGVAMVVTPVKAALILLWFMHLKYEALVFKLMFLAAILILAIVMGLTFFDYSFL